jgi:hypothetical protein
MFVVSVKPTGLSVRSRLLSVEVISSWSTQRSNWSDWEPRSVFQWMFFSTSTSLWNFAGPLSYSISFETISGVDPEGL